MSSLQQACLTLAGAKVYAVDDVDANFAGSGGVIVITDEVGGGHKKIDAAAGELGPRDVSGRAVESCEGQKEVLKDVCTPGIYAADRVCGSMCDAVRAV